MSWRLLVTEQRNLLESKIVDATRWRAYSGSWKFTFDDRPLKQLVNFIVFLQWSLRGHDIIRHQFTWNERIFVPLVNNRVLLYLYKRRLHHRVKEKMTSKSGQCRSRLRLRGMRRGKNWRNGAVQRWVRNGWLLPLEFRLVSVLK